MYLCYLVRGAMVNKIVDKETMENICKIGMGRQTCRYLIVGPEGIQCAKNTALKSTIDSRVDRMAAKSDNCEGL